MNGMRKGLLLAAIQIALVLSLGGKLMYDRMTRPRAWVQVEAFDPELPIRGRYFSEHLQISTEGFALPEVKKQINSRNWGENEQWAYLEVRDGQLIGKAQGSGAGLWIQLRKNEDGTIAGLSEEPVLFFISERAAVPRLEVGEQMWVEVTIPSAGPPRPIRMGIKKGGVLTPLTLR